MKIAGIDEAGRGPVIGPIVMAICSIEEKELTKLEELGIKDSKLIAPKKREFLFNKIKELCDYKIITKNAWEIDEALNNPEINLNWLEALNSIKIIKELKKESNFKIVILDCPSTNIRAYKEYITNRIPNRDYQIVVEHKADLNNIIVGAASILAKVTRDKIIEKIKKEINYDFGSGYPSDPKTKKFLEEYITTNFKHFRKTWKTYINALKKHKQNQTKLKSF